MVNRTMHFCFVCILFCSLHGNDQMFGIILDQCLLRTSVAFSLSYRVIPAWLDKHFSFQRVSCPGNVHIAKYDHVTQCTENCHRAHRQSEARLSAENLSQ